MPRIPDDVIERVKEATDIVEVVSEHVQLTRRTGSNLFGLCPFHNEKTPSFSVNVDRQFYHCFGCGTGGNVFQFVQEVDHVSFLEAVAYLAQRAGIRLPEQGSAGAREEASDPLYRANELARKYYHHLLLKDRRGHAALQYLRRRGVTDDTLEAYGLGYAPADWDSLLKVAGRRGIDAAALERAGLALRRRNGAGHYDRFRDRVAFPICSVSARTVAFGARALQDDQEPKYLNSPETAIYHKGAVLYGLHLTQKAIREEGEALVVEGYMDLLSLVQNGIGNVVASAGTALTDEQCRLVGRYASRVVLVFDGDAAGSRAALRGLEALISAGLDAAAVPLPVEHDPDSYVREKGADGVRELITGARSALDFYFDSLSREHDLSTLAGRARAMEATKPLLLKTRDPVRRDLLLREVASRLAVDERAVRQELGQESRLPRSRLRRPAQHEDAAEAAPLRERQFLGLLLSHPEFIERTAERLKPTDLEDPRSQALARSLFEQPDPSALDVSRLLSGTEDAAMVRFVSACAMEGFDEAQVEQQWQESVAHLQQASLTSRIEQGRAALQAAATSGDQPGLERINAEIMDLVRQRQALVADGSS